MSLRMTRYSNQVFQQAKIAMYGEGVMFSTSNHVIDCDGRMVWWQPLFWKSIREPTTDSTLMNYKCWHSLKWA